MRQSVATDDPISNVVGIKKNSYNHYGNKKIINESLTFHFLFTPVLIFYLQSANFFSILKVDLQECYEKRHVDNLLLGGEKRCRKKKFFKTAFDS